MKLFDETTKYRDINFALAERVKLYASPPNTMSNHNVWWICPYLPITLAYHDCVRMAYYW